VLVPAEVVDGIWLCVGDHLCQGCMLYFCQQNFAHIRIRHALGRASAGVLRMGTWHLVLIHVRAGAAHVRLEGPVQAPRLHSQSHS